MFGCKMFKSEKHVHGIQLIQHKTISILGTTHRHLSGLVATMGTPEARLASAASALSFELEVFILIGDPQITV
jgi:hypothetical protein